MTDVNPNEPESNEPEPNPLLPPGGQASPPPPPPDAQMTTPPGGQTSPPPPPGGQFGGPPPPGGPVGAYPPPEGYAYAATANAHPATWGPRAVASVIDWGLGFAISMVGFFGGMAIGGTGGEVIYNLFSLVGTIFAIWNYYFLQGKTGQTLGKKQIGIMLVKDQTNSPVGAGAAFVRWLVSTAIGVVTCGLYFLADYLWPLWDKDKKRLTDKMLKNSVVVGGEKGGKLLPTM